MNWMKITHLMSKKSLNLMTPFCTYTFISKKITTFLDVQTREKQHFSVMYTMYAYALNNNLLTLTSYEKSLHG